MCSSCNKDVRPGIRERERQAANTRYHANADALNAQQQVRRHTAEGAAVRKATRLADYASDPAKYIKRVTDRRLQALGIADSHTQVEWQVRLDEFNGACAYCLRQDVPLTQEHVTPVSWGTLSSNAIQNVIPACQPCNSSKGDRNLLLFLQHQQVALTQHIVS